jgi:GAF domain-containing protein
MTPVGEILLSIMNGGGAASGASLPVLLCADARRRLPVMGVGITLVDAGGLVASVAASDPVSSGLEDLQLGLGEGPAVEASRSGRLVMVPDLSTVAPDRWPAYTPAALDEGARAVMAYPLRIGGIHLGVLSLYRSEAGTLDEDGLALALRYADAAILILLHLQSLEGRGGRGVGPLPGAGDGLRPPDTPVEIAFQGQPEVHQATGMVSAQVGVGLKEALLLLQAHAFSEGVPIVEVARDVVDRRMSFNHRS